MKALTLITLAAISFALSSCTGLTFNAFQDPQTGRPVFSANYTPPLVEDEK